MKTSRAALLLSSLLIVILFSIGWPKAIASSISRDDQSSGLSVERQSDFRRSIGFRSDAAHISSLQSSNHAVFLESLGGLVLSPNEHEELQVRLEIEKDLDAILAYFESDPALRTAFGGIYIEHFPGAEDHTEGGRLILQLVESRQRLALRALSRLPLLRHPDRLETRWVAYSQQELEAEYNRILATPNFPELHSIYVDTKQNVVGVVVNLGADSAALQQPGDIMALPIHLQPLLNSPAIVVYYGNATVDRLAYRGGQSWTAIKGGVPRCTIGFKVTITGSKYFAFVTAGHCIVGDARVNPPVPPMIYNDPVYHDSLEIGKVSNFQVGSASQFGIGVDAAHIRLRSSTLVTDDVIYFGKNRDIIGETASEPIGAVRCQTGVTTGTNCGPITCQNVTYYDPYYKVWNNRVITFNANSDRGDSGAPVYQPIIDLAKVRITGVLIGHFPSALAPGCIAGEYDAGVSRWTDIRDLYGFTLVTNR